jgi:hypothetical protein
VHDFISITARFIGDSIVMNRAATTSWRNASVYDGEVEKQKDWEPEVLQPRKLKAADLKLTKTVNKVL